MLSPDGRNVYGLCSSARCIFAFRRDEESGLLEMVQRLKDGDNAISVALLLAIRRSCSLAQAG
jgi:hypothetical protein